MITVSKDDYEQSLLIVKNEYEKLKNALIKNGQDPHKASVEALKFQINRYKFMLDMEGCNG